MQLTDWLNLWWSPRKPARRRSRHGKSEREGATRAKVAAELLEQRMLPAVITVTSLADTIANDGQVTLREAIQAANTNTTVDGVTGSGADTIQFAPSLTASSPATITLSGTQLAITSDINILGPGADRLTIDGNRASGIFKVDDGNLSSLKTVTISGLTLTGGQNNFGGAIESTDNLTVRDSVITSNTAQSIGGGIASRIGTLTVMNSTISNNSAGDGGGIKSDNGTLTVVQSVITGNVADYRGGGIYCRYPVGATTISQSTISGNVTRRDDGFGGGLASYTQYYQQGTVAISQSTISQNSAGYGGGVAIFRAALTVSQSTIAGNTAKDPNGLREGGIGFSTYGTANPKLTNTIVAGNTWKGQPSDLARGRNLSADSRNNLIGDPGTASGLLNGVNGNIIGNGSGGVLDVATVLNMTLSDNGGPTQTHTLVIGSPAINAGDNGSIPTDTLDLDVDGNTTEAMPFDQRGSGFTRLVGSSVDIGAFESQTSGAALPVVTVAVSPASVTEDGSGNLVFTLARDLTSGSLAVNFSLTGLATSGTDYLASATNAVTFADGASTATVTVDPTSDDSSEVNESVVLTVVSGTDYLVELNANATGTIVNDDGSLSIAATSASKPEGNSGNTPFTFTVTRTGDTSGSASANFAIAGSGLYAADATDFGGTLPSGTISFAAGETSKTITINVSSDAALESDEAFTVTLSNATGISLGTATATGTIRNDDAVLTIAPSNGDKAEGNSGFREFTFRINRTGDSTTAVSVDYAVSGKGANPADATDFGGTLPTGTVTLAVGEMSKTFDILVSGDTTFEPFQETFTVTLSHPIGAVLGTQVTWDGTISNDDAAPIVELTSTATFVVDTLVDENDGNYSAGDFSLREAIARANALAGAQTITFAPSLTASGPATIVLGGTDILINSDLKIEGPGANRLTIDGNLRSRIFNIDDNNASRKTVIVSGLTFASGSNAFGGAIENRETLTVTDCLFRNNVSSNEGGAIRAFGGDLYVVRSTFSQNSAKNYGGAIAVRIGTLSVAQSTIDHNSVTSFGGGINASDATVAIHQSTIANNSSVYYGGGIIVERSDSVISQSTIVANQSRWSGGIEASNSGALTLKNSIIAGNVATSDSDLRIQSNTLNFAVSNLIGDSSGAGGIINGVNGNIVGNSGSGVLDLTSVLSTTLADNGGTTKTLILVAGSPAIDAGDESSVPPDTLDLDGDSNRTEGVPFDQRGNGYARVSGARVDMGAVEFGSVYSPIPYVTVAVSAASVAEDGSGNLVFTLTRDVATGPLTVNFSLSGTATSGSDYSADATDSVTFADGASTATVTVDPTTDSNGEADESVMLTLTSGAGYGVGSSNSATGTFLDDDNLLSIAAASASKSEGNIGSTPFTFTVTRTGSTSSTASASYAVTGSGANAANGTDFSGTLPSGTINFAALETSKTITINVGGDTAFEADEGFVVTLSNSVGAGLGTSSATGTIVNDDNNVSITAADASKPEGNTGNTPLTFTVNRTGDPSDTASVNFAVAGSGNHAADANDFGGILPSGTVNFAAGETSQTITIHVRGDTIVESHEGFTVTLSNPGIGVTIGTPTASGTIQNDEPSIVANWRFENGASDAAATTSGSIHDGSGNGHDGIPMGSPLYRNVPNGLGLEFDGVNDRIFVPDNPAFGFTESFTLEAILRFDGTTSNTIIYNQIIFRGDDRGALDPYFLAVTLDGRLIFHVENQSGNASEVVSPARLPIGEFVHVAGSLDDLTGEQKLYVNGVAVASKVTAIRPFASLDASRIAGLGIGSVQSGAFPQLFHGVIDEVRISDAALAPSAFLGGGSPFLPALTTDDLASVLLDESGNLRIRDLAAGGRADRLTVSFDADSQEIVILDSQNSLKTSIGTIASAQEVRVTRAVITGNGLRVELNGQADQLDLSGLPAGLLAIEVDGGDGNDTIIGHAGADLILGGRGNDSVSAGAGNDTLAGAEGNDVLRGEAGNDVLRGQTQNDRLIGGDGDDTCDGGGGDDNLSGEAGNDSLMGSTGNDVLSGGDGRDKVLGGDGHDRLEGNSGNDRLNGGLGNDSVDGGAGNDFLEGQAGNDLINGGAGDDTLQGGFNDDTLIGLAGHDRLDGGDGNDVAKGGEGNDTLLGGNGNDNLSGSVGNDVEDGGAGTDTLAGGDGDDSLAGGEGNDYLHGDNGLDNLHGDAGDDSLDGGAGQDVISVDLGGDILLGDDDDDILV